MRVVLILQRMMQRYGKYTRKSILPLRGYGKYTRIYGIFLIKKRRYKKITPCSSFTKCHFYFIKKPVNIIFLFCPVICFFAFSSVIGWGLYGIKFSEFLFGQNAKNIFLTLFLLAQMPAAVFRADAVWVIAEIFNGLMCLPNITALLFLTNEIADTVGIYKRKHRGV